MTLPASYEDTFQRFDQTGGRWIPTWNWAAFALGILWYFYRGMWVKGLIYFVALLAIGTVTGGFALPLTWAAFGLVANYDLYLLRRKGTQLWDGSGVASVSLPTSTGVVSPSALAPAPSHANTRLTALENARSQGVISDLEYAEKRQQLEQDAEREKKLAALEDMRRAGIISPMEYEAKKRDILLGAPTSAPSAIEAVSGSA